MLQESFYQTKAFIAIPGPDDRMEVVSTMEFIDSHEIFSGHFPGNPIVPGVCMVQIIIELVSKALARPVKLVRCDNLKFLRLIRPEAARGIEARIIITSGADEGNSVSATFHDGHDFCTRFKGYFLPDV